MLQKKFCGYVKSYFLTLSSYRCWDASLVLIEQDESKAKDPNGLVPTIDDDGFILRESRSIMQLFSTQV
jgi:glutathione S-transferase